MAFYTGRLQDQRDRAQLEARRSAEIVDFLTGLFREANPSETLGETVTVQDLLGARRFERPDATWPEDPDVQATMLGVIGSVYSSMRVDSRAVEFLRQAYDHLTRHPLTTGSGVWRGPPVGSVARSGTTPSSRSLDLCLTEALAQFEALLAQRLPRRSSTA